MNSHIATLQTIAELSHPGIELGLPPFYREILSKGDIWDYEKLQEFMVQELQSGSVQIENSARYVDFVGRQLIMIQFCRRDRQLLETLDIIHHRVQAAKSAASVYLEVPIWEAYLSIVRAAFLRTTRNSTLEAFEESLSNIPWSTLQQDPKWVSLVSGVLGLTYVQEDSSDQVSKAILWLEQAIKTGEATRVLVFQCAKADFYHKTDAPIEQTQKIVTAFRSTDISFPNNIVKQQYFLASLDLENRVLAHQIATSKPSYTQFERNQTAVTAFDHACRRVESMPSVSVAYLEAKLAELQVLLHRQTEDHVEQELFASRTLKYFDRALEAAETMKDPLTVRDLRLRRAQAAAANQTNVTEKELKEILAAYKKSQDYYGYAQTVKLFLQVMAKGHQWVKLYDLIQDMLRYGAKQDEENGYYLQISAMQMANGYFVAETVKPAVSWMVQKLASYFEAVSALITELMDPAAIKRMGKSQFQLFRESYADLEPASHFNIYVYYRYQYQTVRLMKVSFVYVDDALGKRLAHQLLGELEEDNNPMSIIKADWPDFKDVPNSVRNKTLNKCISISKGDLPLAAELLDFSYRNLRSYITFKEVNRLGFFLDHQDTANRQLELGIRYMFHDLYKSGTIFEVVFDMPKFLVEHAQSGFYSTDLEEALVIKGTTAKKYIKIMMTIDMIRQEKVPGRKHFYRIQKDVIMKRLGKDQTTLIQ